MKTRQVYVEDKGDVRAPLCVTEQIEIPTNKRSRSVCLFESIYPLTFFCSLFNLVFVYPYPVFPVKMSDDGEQNPPPFHDVAEDTLLSSDESEENLTLSDDGEEDALASLGVHCNDHLPLQELKMALT